MSRQAHPLAELFPLMEGADFDEFCAGLKTEGRLHDKIVLLDGLILDGRNRQRACEATGVTAHYRVFDPLTEGDPLKFVIAKNLHRRHLNESQRAMAAARIARLGQGARTDISPIGEKSQRERAEIMNVGKRTVERADDVVDRAAPEIVRAVDRGKMSVAAAAAAAKLDPEKQRRIAEEVEAGRPSSARTIIKKASRENREAALADKQRALPTKKYGVILADPEWRFEPYSRETGMDRAADNHYPTSPTEAIAARPVQSIAANDCVLFLWATAPMMPDALRVMGAWGFEYKTHLVWHKLRSGAGRGSGYWFTGEHELLLVGTRGKIPAPATALCGSLIAEPWQGRHSAKPEAFAALIERAFPSLPKIELNARRARAGWDRWGLDAPDGDADDAPGPAPETDGPAPDDRETGELIEPSDDDVEDIPNFLRRGDPECAIGRSAPP